MCLLCVEYNMGRLTRQAVQRNISKYLELQEIAEEHAEEIIDLINEEPEELKSEE